MRKPKKPQKKWLAGVIAFIAIIIIISVVVYLSWPQNDNVTKDPNSATDYEFRMCSRDLTHF